MFLLPLIAAAGAAGWFASKHHSEQEKREKELQDALNRVTPPPAK